MNTSLRHTGLAAALATAIVLTGCGPSDDSQPTMVRSPETPAPPVVAVDGPMVIEVGVDDSMAFAVTRIEAAAGQEIELTIRHTGRMTKEQMGHNWVLLAKGTDKNAFAMAAVAARDNDYLPPDRMENVLAHTKMIGGGQSDTITFTVPEETGEYDFVCTFPGHTLAGMVGVLVVR